MAMTRAQSTASDPRHSVWVSANAGTGKTKVLTDRVLRLLLDGNAPARILCITYTTAAAAEMENRIYSTLRRWVAYSEEELASALSELTGEAPTPERFKLARQLFATVLDAPDGVRIQTIHGFCQSLLRRFPLEAGIQPHFEVIDERTALELLNEAKQRLFSHSLRQGEEGEQLAASVKLLAGRLAETQFHDLLKQLVAGRRHFAPLFHLEGGALQLIERTYSALGVPLALQESDLFDRCFAYQGDEEESLRCALNHLLTGSKTDIERGRILADWFAEPHEGRFSQWSKYRQAWLTKGEKRQKLATDAVKKNWTPVQDVLLAEQERVYDFECRLRALSNAAHSESAIHIIEGLLEHYNHLKSIYQYLDYDDLILYSLRLLMRDGVSPWVLFKLDGGLDHVLIDEAQDTSPEQWRLVEYLVGEFFSGAQARAKLRTLFVVGDEKQSIYSFQGAEPRAFSEKRSAFSQRAVQAELSFQAIPLGLSYRSTQALLSTVDQVFASPLAIRGLSFMGESVSHGVYREGHAGRVELWPLIDSVKRTKEDVWQVRQDSEIYNDPMAILADRMARTIAGWLKDGEMLASQNRAVRAGDVLVLLRRRNAFMHHLVRSLKRMGVPVAGVDRMVVTENIAVMDLMALAEFLLLPEDDLNLACLLKSPLCGLDEDELFTLAHGRGKQSLWSRMRESAVPSVEAARELLETLLARVDFVRPYELFSELLEEKGGRRRFAERLGDEVFDPLEEFLSLSLQYERSHAPSLQGFLHWLRSGEVEIKRDMEHGQDAVRIMTVHGAKGLQAPIVFLPDTVDASPFRNRPLWGQEHGLPVMLWSPSSAEDSPAMAALRETYKQAEEEESRRLLYVAMTRAEDRLYVCGWLGRGRKMPEDCWYGLIREGLKGRAQPYSLTFPPLVPGGEPEVVEGLLLDEPQTAAVKEQESAVAKAAHPPMPDYLRAAPAAEPFPPQPLVPSRYEEGAALTPSGQENVISPVADEKRFARGNLIHRLLQWLPSVPEAERRAAAETYLTHYGREFPEADRTAMVREVLEVIVHPEMGPVFAPGSLAEVSVSGLVNTADAPQLLSGQIDRLAVNDSGVWIIDYKTQRQPPETLAEIPEAYRRQMAAYRAALEAIYPGLPVHTALLWTVGPRLMVLP